MRVKGVNAVDALDRLETALDSSDISNDSTNPHHRRDVRRRP
jgi:hypothetical protein